MRVFFFLFLVTFFWCNVTLADEKLPDIRKIPDLELIPKDTMDKFLLKDVLKRLHSEDMTPTIMLTVSFALAKLMYFNPMPEKQIREAIKKFQSDLGQDRTGELTMGQLDELTRRSNRLSDDHILVPSIGETLDVMIGGGLATAVGTWTLEGEKHDFPINLTQIDCLKPLGTCETNRIYISIPHLNDPNEGIFMVHTPVIEKFKIISWTNNEVVSQRDSKCRTTIMTMNKNNNEVFQITRNKGNEECVTLPQLKKPRIARLNPGTKTSRVFWNNRQMKTNKYINSEVQGQIKALSTILNSTKKDKQKKTQNNSKPE